jgi:predicted membrane chloride channel (bestrophin family)
MKVIRSLFLIINYKTFVIMALAVISTWACGYFRIVADFPLTLIGIAIVFPVVFSIGAAYKRRERALAYLGDFKAHLLALYFASRDWVKSENGEFPKKMRAKINETYNSLRELFMATPEKWVEYEDRLYVDLSDISSMNQEFRDRGLQAGEVSRVSQYLSKLAVALEGMKVVLRYRTPITLRAYSKVFIYSFPILYGPTFEFMAESFSYNLKYMMPIMFSFILVSLDNIQEHLENPFDQVGEDDIKFDVEEFTELIK